MEIPHRQQIESKNHEIDIVTDQMYELKRQLDISKIKLERVKFEAEKDVKHLKEKHQVSLLLIKILIFIL